MIMAEDLSHLVVFVRQLDRGVIHSADDLDLIISRMKTDLAKQMVEEILLEFWFEEKKSFVWKLV